MISEADLRMLLSVRHLLLQEGLSRLHAVILHKSLCNDRKNTGSRRLGETRKGVTPNDEVVFFWSNQYEYVDNSNRSERTEGLFTRSPPEALL